MSDLSEHSCDERCELYYCPQGDEMECPVHGGFDVCCEHPELHRPFKDAIRFTLYIDGELVTQEWVPLTDEGVEYADSLGRTHIAASQAGKKFLIEIYDPSLPEDEAYVRFGTDHSMMERPTTASIAEVRDIAMAQLIGPDFYLADLGDE